MSTDLEIIKQKIALHKEYLKKTYGVKEIGVFGSYARGDNDENSDIDIVVDLQKPLGLQFFSLERHLEEYLGRKVDLATKKAIKPYIRERILAQIIYV
ncbi:MAG TPA: nucleotidyltransferase [Candidatus Vogelbacteria bacterium]|uniref:Nucleotidyltransferase n=1 Tax=Candidatus Vogelbacteria bacterium RIFOXYD1_FULL_51_18 TaxID=1802440 RepID=A0A1G2QM20_9BACT|nr:MAG: polymerase beta domain protein region protein [Parcubacteria group bacterium GW2011_GWF2_52_12]KKW27908.1 MAG: polymerase beta domain protein region protein [Parcubacteria group bacterium GW2011_GWF1_52_5]OHA61129.1 MAG: nucleotidyltransferase [Candidatus Vogelbacteria bacterium RIFOXYD1_FULL_51_18]HBB65210.1 nucleotidyltransferase [Candidatus Vogelbacteria bacterium]HBC44077.1 nucleotidyltransferase [Candidatus Vogelbacteria bacterium]